MGGQLSVASVGLTCPYTHPIQIPYLCPDSPQSVHIPLLLGAMRIQVPSRQLRNGTLNWEGLEGSTLRATSLKGTALLEGSAGAPHPLPWEKTLCSLANEKESPKQQLQY